LLFPAGTHILAYERQAYLSIEKVDRNKWLWVPSLATGANVACGFGSMFLAADGRYNLAVYLLFAAIFFDVLDGRLARLLRATSEIGKQLDSFSDALSFGAAPAFLIQKAIFPSAGWIGFAAATIYLLAVVYRLARFNLTSDTHEKARRTVGVPCPVGASYLMAAVMMRDQLEPIWGVGLTLFMAVMVVTHWSLPELKGKSIVTFMMIVGVFNYYAVIFHPGWRAIIWWNIWNALILVAAHLEDRRMARDAREADSLG
jgi:CDP-diacylglycerol--serine O-phosphatidyltransferase